MRRILPALVSSLVALSAFAAEVVKTVHPSREVIIAESVLAPRAFASDGDDGARLQAAIDGVHRCGGGTVFLAKGVYRLGQPLTLRRGVTLRGDYDAAHPADSTVLAIVHGAGDAEGPAAISVEQGSGLVGLVFHYPEQCADHPTPYPWTVRSSLRNAGNNQTVEDCTFVNSYRALAIGPESNECHTFRRVRICALKTGFFIDMTTDIGRVYDVTVSPSVWTESGFARSPDLPELARALKACGAVAADYARSDWEYIRALRIGGYPVGLRIRRGKSRVGMNGVMAACEIANCGVALAADALNEVGLAVYDCTFGGNATNLVCSESFDSVVQFHSCRFAGGPLVLGPKGTVNLRASRLDAPIDASAGGALMRDDAPSAAHVAFSPMEFPRPKGDGVVFAAVDAGADDCTAAIQSALDAAGSRPSGATVYLPAGVYRCRGTLTVPSGVELRGAIPVPHHTANGGTVLFVYAGRGEENGTAFCSLRPGAGLRGLSFWYPEQDVGAPVAYPWTVRSLGAGCWMTDVNIANSDRGADFATHPSNGHRISYFSGGFYRAGLKVGNCSGTGWVEEVQMNPHYVYRRPGDHPLREPRETGRGEPAFMLYQRDHLEGLVFENCADERISGTFLYAARDGIVFRGKMKASLLIHGTDTGCRAFTVKTVKGSSVAGALVQLVCLGRQAESALAVLDGNEGDVTILSSQYWPRFPVLDQRGTGRTVLDQFNDVAGPVRVHTGSAEIRAGIFRHPHEKCVDASPEANVRCLGLRTGLN